MKRRFLILILPLLIIGLGWFFRDYFLNDDTGKEKEVFVVDKTFFSKLEPGDILLKHGKGPVSKMIIKYLNESKPFSHCGIICKNSQNDTPFIIHSVAKELSGRDGVQTISLQDFIHDTQQGTLWVVRRKINQKLRKQIADKANFYLENKSTFDYDFDHIDTTKIYCTELIYHCLNHIDPSLNIMKTVRRENKTVLAFGSLTDTTFFDIIVN